MFFMDIEWYGVDKNGNIAVFCNAGKANVPEFVCENRERAEEIAEYFEMRERTTNSILYFHSIESAEQIAKDFSDKGLFYFDANDGTQFGVATLHTYYTKLSTPLKPLKYNTLPERIRRLLKNNYMEVEDFSSMNEIHIMHAYS